MDRGGGHRGGRQGGGHSSGSGRGRQTWRTVACDSSPDHQTPVGADVSSYGRMPGSSGRKSNSQGRTSGRGSVGSVSRHPENGSPGSRVSQRRGWSAFGGESYPRGDRAKVWGASSESSNSSDIDHDKHFRSTPVQSNFAGQGTESSSLNLDQSFLENVDHPLDLSHVLKESAAGDGHSEAKFPESVENVCSDDISEKAKCSVPIDAFDICPPKTGSVVMLKPSLLARNREKRVEMKRSVDGPKGIILRPGMVLLKNYLSISEQANILRICRNHGLGPAGFYQPCFSDGGKMHLKLMCFGKFWDPETNKYGDVRPMDHAKPPPVPQDFLRFVERAIKESHSRIADECRVKNVQEILPSVKPDICLVNYYATVGRLGLHQDKDESRESLEKGIPIVSFSIGDSAEFLYCDQRDAEKPEKVILESGDVLIFGGKSRHIFHGVSAILPDTSPKSLLEQSNFRSGRINLTFRQHR